MKLSGKILSSLLKRILQISKIAGVMDYCLQAEFALEISKEIKKRKVWELADFLIRIEACLEHVWSVRTQDLREKHDYFEKIIGKFSESADAELGREIRSLLDDHNFLAKKRSEVERSGTLGELESRSRRSIPFVSSGEPGISGHYFPSAD